MDYKIIKRLNEERGDTLAAMKTILTKAETEKRELSSEESGKFDELNGTAERLKTQAERHMKVYELEGEHTQQTRSLPGREDFTGHQDNQDTGKALIEKREAAFNAYLRFGVAGMDNEQRSLLQTDSMLINGETRAISRGSDVWGTRGFQAELVKSLRDFTGVIDAGARIITTANGNEIGMLTVDDTANSASTEKTEGSAAADDVDPSFASKSLGAFTYDSGVVLVPVELLQDSEVDLGSEILALASERIGVRLNQRTTLGSGTGQPQGFVTGATVGKTAASETAITYEELLDFFHSVGAPYRRRGGTWQFNDATLAALRKLKDGDGRYIFTTGTAGQPDQILGKPYVVNPDMADIASGTKPIAFGDFSTYRVRFVANPFVRRLEEAYATRRMVGFYVAQRADGRMTDAKAIKSFQMDDGE